VNLAGASQGYIDFLNQSQQRDVVAQQLAEMKRQSEAAALQQQQDQAAQENAGRALPGMRGAIPPPPQTPMPGQSSQPMGPPPMQPQGTGQMPVPPNAGNLQPNSPGMKAPARGNDAIMITKEEFQKATDPGDKQALTRELMRLGVPQQTIMQWAQEAMRMQGLGQGIPQPPGAAPGGPPQAAPAGPQPYQTVPSPDAQPPAPSPQAAGGIPPPPSGAPPQGAAPGGGFTMENVVQRLTDQGLAGADLWRALNKLAPMMDANFKQQVQALNQQIAVLKEQDRIRHENVMEGQGQAKVDQAGQRVAQGDRRLDIQQQNADTAKTRAATYQKRSDEIAGSGTFTEDDVKYWGDVMISGGSLPPRLATTPGGKKLTTDVMKYVAGSGVSAKAMLLNQAEFQGLKAGERTLGNRTANIEMAVNEADQLADLAGKASEDFKRTGYKKLNDLYQAVEAGTASPELRRFVAANTSFINAYARAISPSGVPTVSDKEHAREMLSTAFSEGDYAATIDQLKKEMSAAKKSPGMVREGFREGYGDKGALRAPAAPEPPKPGDVVKGYKFKGGDPSKQESWEKA